MSNLQGMRKRALRIARQIDRIEEDRIAARTRVHLLKEQLSEERKRLIDLVATSLGIVWDGVTDLQPLLEKELMLCSKKLDGIQRRIDQYAERDATPN